MRQRKLRTTGDRIRHLRTLKKETQKQFAETINISQNHLSSIETLVRTPTARIITDICDKYKVNREWLTLGQGEIFKDELEEYDIQDEEIKEMLRLFLKADDETKELIKNIMKKTIKE